MIENLCILLSQVKKMIVDTVYPPRCILCDGLLSINEKYHCKECDISRYKVAGNLCIKCGKPIYPYETLCQQCKEQDFHFTKGRSLFIYEGSLHSTMYRLKYGNRQDIGINLGELLASQIGEKIKSWNVELILPVPLHKKRFKFRGYNQAYLLSQGIGATLGIDVKDDVLLRSKETKVQSSLNGFARRNNLKDAIEVVMTDIKQLPERILIVDDIYTSGSTIDQCAKVLLEHGAKNVFFVVVAVAI